MSSIKVLLRLVALVLLIISAVPVGASRVEARGLPMGQPRTGSGLRDDIGHECATLSIVTMTPDVSSFRNKVAFQVYAPPWCSWGAASALIEDINPAQGAGSQHVTGSLPPNNGDQSRTAQISITSQDGVIVRTAAVTQAAAV